MHAHKLVDHCTPLRVADPRLLRVRTKRSIIWRNSHIPDVSCDETHHHYSCVDHAYNDRSLNVHEASIRGSCSWWICDFLVRSLISITLPFMLFMRLRSRNKQPSSSACAVVNDHKFKRSTKFASKPKTLTTLERSGLLECRISLVYVYCGSCVA